jgi:ATP adenylyltransferase
VARRTPTPTSEEAAAGCPFCALPAAQLVAQNRLACAVRDRAPATPLHTLVLPRRHVASWFDLIAAERRAIDALVAEEQRRIRAQDAAVAGFNIAVNIGRAAGQTVFHCHLHLVPRRPGDGDAVVLSGARKHLL